MSKETLEIIQKTDWESIEMRIAFQCAPFLAGLKMSNLLIFRREELDELKHILKQAGISYFVVAEMAGKAMVLVFDRNLLEAYLQEGKVRQIFQDMGYQDFALGKILLVFRLRYEAYLMQKQQFPHEMGLLLGYPVEDVEGFIFNCGRNCLYAGYWKVYKNLPEKLLLFRKFEKARDAVVQLSFNGIGISEIIQKRKVN
ncbi:MAG: DUF3793 family protein [Roseburia sp.]|nr:DUF3793 family protein [Roseburia sp.]